MSFLSFLCPNYVFCPIYILYVQFIFLCPIYVLYVLCMSCMSSMSYLCPLILSILYVLSIYRICPLCLVYVLCMYVRPRMVLWWEEQSPGMENPPDTRNLLFPRSNNTLRSTSSTLKGSVHEFEISWYQLTFWSVHQKLF